MGVVIGLVNAVSVSVLNILLKKLSGLHPNFLTAVRVAGSVPILAILVTLFVGWHIPEVPFWQLLIFAIVPVEIVLAYVGTKSLHLSPISIIAPLGAFTSVFLIPVGYFILGELPTALGLLGVLAIFIGSFFLGWERGARFVLGYTNMLRDKGVLLALLGAFLASVAISFTKLSFTYASPLLAAFYIHLFLFAALSPFLLLQRRTAYTENSKKLIGLSAVQGLGASLHVIGLSLLPAVYFVSIKRLSVIFNVLSGKTFFQEEHIGERIIGAVLMVGGVMLIALG